MKTGPVVSQIASLIGDPARANILMALMDGRALTASELARQAGVALSTASSHLGKLQSGQLLALEKQGRHRYFRLANEDVAHALETLMALADKSGHRTFRTGPRDPALRAARVCYDHLAGERAVQMFEALVRRKLLTLGDSGIRPTPSGRAFLAEFGVDLDVLDAARRPLCRACLDWSSRRHHLAGSLGMALLERTFALGWASRGAGTRIVTFTRAGEAKFCKMFGIA